MPFSMSDAELSQVMTLATAIPPRHRRAYLREVAAVLGGYPEDNRGPGLVYREALRLQRQFATNVMRPTARGKYG
jgi:hypothetical protein